MGPYNGGSMDADARIHERPVKRALRRADLSGTFIVGKYALSPYMACGHGCAYCDGRAERYYVEGEFDRDIVARRNLPELLARELPRLREPGFVTLGSGISDVYQPAEAKERITRRCAEILTEHDHPVTVMTKSDLALRDLDLWKRVNERRRFVFIVSIVHRDDGTRRTFEPGAAAIEARLEALRAFKEAGCATGVLAMPILPGVGDAPEEVSRLYDTLAETGVDFIQAGGLTLRPGRQKEYYLRRLERSYPVHLPLYDELYRENRPSGAPIAAYTRRLARMFLREHARIGLPYLMPHHIYARHLATYDEASVLLQHMAELYRANDIDTSPLRAATKRFFAWLGPRKREYNRHRSWDYRNLSEELLAPGHLEELLDNPRLAEFLRQVLVEGGVLDYVTLRLAEPGRAAGPQGGADTRSASGAERPGGAGTP